MGPATGATGNRSHVHIPDTGPSETSIRYEDEDIALTRQDLTTRDLGGNDYRTRSVANACLQNVDTDGYYEKEKSPTSPRWDNTHSPNAIPSTIGTRPQFPLHGHHTSWSTTQSSRELTGESNGTSIRPQLRSTAPSADSRTPLNPTPSSDTHISKLASPVQALEPGTKAPPRTHRSSSSFGTVGRSLSRGGSPRSPIRRVFARTVHAADANTPMASRDPGAMEAGVGTEMSSGESSTATGGKRPPWWQRNAASKRDEEAETRGKEKDGVKGRTRGRERHPLDHQYEMDTILTGGGGVVSEVWSATETQTRPLEASQMHGTGDEALEAPPHRLHTNNDVSTNVAL